MLIEVQTNSASRILIKRPNGFEKTKSVKNDFICRLRVLLTMPSQKHPRQKHTGYFYAKGLKF